MITTLLRYDHQIEVIPSQDLHFRSPHQSTGSCHQNQQCQLWAETSSIKTKLPCSETFHLRFYLDYQQQKVFLTSSQPRMSGAQFQCLELSLVPNRPVRILTLKRGNKFLGIGVIITSDVIPSSGISRHSRTTPPPLRGQVDKSDLVVRGPFAGTKESTMKSAGITVITSYQADISWTLATTLLFHPVAVTNGKKSFKNLCL